MFQRVRQLLCFALMVTLLSSAQPPAEVPNGPGKHVALAAEAQIGKTRFYDPAYVKLSFPMGDVPITHGVCADVVVRALRQIGIDLQHEVNRDMRANFSRYPTIWRARKPDRNIDHRRVRNLEVFFERRGWARVSGTQAHNFVPGDIVTWRLASGLPHTGVVSTRHGLSGRYLIVHNIGAGARMEDVLLRWKITGHYRVRS